MVPGAEAYRPSSTLKLLGNRSGVFSNYPQLYPRRSAARWFDSRMRRKLRVREIILAPLRRATGNETPRASMCTRARRALTYLLRLLP